LAIICPTAAELAATTRRTPPWFEAMPSTKIAMSTAA
jgi:hypothetical protein